VDHFRSSEDGSLTVVRVREGRFPRFTVKNIRRLIYAGCLETPSAGLDMFIKYALTQKSFQKRSVCDGKDRREMKGNKVNSQLSIF
jgi:hypothetical protein